MVQEQNHSTYLDILNEEYDQTQLSFFEMKQNEYGKVYETYGQMVIPVLEKAYISNLLLMLNLSSMGIDLPEKNVEFGTNIGHRLGNCTWRSPSGDRILNSSISLRR